MSDVSVTLGSKNVSGSIGQNTPVASLQGAWDLSSSADKNTFVDANNFEIITYQKDGAEETAALARFTGLTLAEKAAIVTFVESQVNSGNWALIDEFAHYGLQTEANALTGWKSKTQTNVNASTHTPSSGFTFNGTTQYLNTNFNPSTDATNLSLNDALLGVWGLVLDMDNVYLGAYEAAAGTALTIQTSNSGGNKHRALINDLTQLITGGVLSNDSLLVQTRTASNAKNAYTNGAVVGSTSITPSIAVPNLNAFVGARNNSGTPGQFLNGQISSMVIGAAVGFDHDNFYDNLVILNTALAAI